jgi:hypothetical protein
LKTSTSSNPALYRTLFIAALALLGVVYLLQCATPLRLHNDTIILVSMAESAAHGDGFLYHGRRMHFPPGYPAILATLMKLGIFHVSTAILVNFAFLALGIWAVWRLVPYPRPIILLTLLSFVTIKHYAIPLTDCVFFGIAMLCLLMLMRDRLLPATILVLIAIAVRHNGVALAPPLLWMLYRRRPILVLPALAAIVADSLRVMSLLPHFNKTVGDLSFFESAVQILGFRLSELGEIAVNIPAGVFPPAAKPAVYCLGLIALFLIGRGMWIASRKLFGPIEIFLLGYAAILFIWPYYDPRFWLPVLPLLFGYAGTAVRRLPTEAFVVYAAVFSMVGLAVLAESTRITFAGTGFPDAYGNGQFRATYCVYYGSCDAGSAEIYPEGLRLLQQYH